jgi:hypothetical protein
MKKEKQDTKSMYKKMSMMGAASRSPSEQRLMALLRIED